MKKQAQRVSSFVLVLMIVFSCFGVAMTAEARSYTVIQPHYSNAVSSYQEISDRLAYLKGVYKCQDNAGASVYWTLDGSAASSIDDSKYYYGWQCNGFAKYIFNDLFCCGNIGSYDSNMYYFPTPNGAYLIDKAWNISSSDTGTVKNILSRGSIGDFIQVRRRGKDYGHSMILTGLDDGGIWIFDCNSDGKCGVKHYYQTWATFASKNIGLSLYHANNYPAPQPQEPPSWAKVSLSQDMYYVGETVTFNMSSDIGTVYTIGIDDANGNRIDTQDTNQTTYSRTFSNAGDYSCYITTYNSKGFADSERIYFKIYDKAPQYAKVSLSQRAFYVGEDVTFSLESDTGLVYTIGIDDAIGNRIDTQDTNNSSYTRSFAVGDYSCYITTYNHYGYKDSERIYFTIYDDKPQWARVELSQSLYYVG